MGYDYTCLPESTKEHFFENRSKTVDYLGSSVLCLWLVDILFVLVDFLNITRLWFGLHTHTTYNLSYR